MSATPATLEAVGARTPRASVLAALALAVVALAHAQGPEVGFVWDDHQLLEADEALHQLRWPWEALRADFWSDPLLAAEGHRYHRPLVTWTFALDWARGEGSPRPFHLTNLALHLAVCALLGWLLRRGGAEGPVTALAIALFGTFPRLTECVTWISGRTDVLATLGVLGALAFDRGTGGRRWRPWAVAACFLLALLSKEVAAVLVLVLGLEALGRVQGGQARVRGELARLAPSLLALGLAVALRPPGATGRIELERPLVQLGAFGRHLGLVATPFWPSPHVGLAHTPEPWAVALGAAGLVIAAVGLGWLWRRGQHAGVALLSGALAALALVSALDLHATTLAADRYLYLPLALATLAVGTWPASGRLGRPGLALGAALVVAFAVVTVRQTALWADELRFWRAQVREAAPGNLGPWQGLGDALFARARLDEARAAYLEAARGGSASARLAVAMTDSHRGEDAAALAQLDALLAERPTWARAWRDRPLFLARSGDFAAARRALDDLRLRFGGLPGLDRLAALLASSALALAVEGGPPLQRAGAWAALGATAHAEAAYRAALPDELAGRWLVLNGSRPSALAVLRARPGDEAASAVFQERWPDDPAP